ncbi:hypothetical protein DPMN_007226 [Dreissena polymorpha]|uniref:Uncharacterized protein n=1 Tax=Dreissena polymorpha TaxID=45954 RepID=A0A9D4MWP1_DREPO|nr:hypothetical protein DPMN_007226 [Dreissena polymorpha]
MARQRPTRGAPGLVMGPCIMFSINLNNRCRNEEVIVKGNFEWAWSVWAEAPQVEIDHIAVRDVQYQFEVNRCRNEEVIGRPRSDRIVIRDVQYQFEVNRCRNEEVRVKGNFGWAWSR